MKLQSCLSFTKIKYFLSFSSAAFADHENTSFPDFFLTVDNVAAQVKQLA